MRCVLCRDWNCRKTSAAGVQCSGCAAPAGAQVIWYCSWMVCWGQCCGCSSS